MDSRKTIRGVPESSGWRQSGSFILRVLHKVLVVIVGVCPGIFAAHAQSTWLAAPGSGDFNTASNWTPATVPTSTAIFDTSNTTTVTFSTPSTSVGSLLFNPAAPTYSFILSGSSLSITGGGIVNNSSNSPIFTVSNVALPLAVLSINGTAGNATIINNNNGETDLVGLTTAGTANITNNGGVTAFEGQSTGGTATITTNNGGLTVFENNPSDGGGQARLITTAGGIVDIGLVTPTGMTAGSIEGAGTYRLGSKALTVGGNNLSTEVSGIIVDGGLSSGVGSLIKVGTGTLTLSGTNTYSGGTTIEGGVISVASDSNLGSMSGGITVSGGELLTTLDGFSSARLVTLNPSAGANTLAAATGTTATYTGVISAGGALTIGDGTNDGTVVLASGANTYFGGTTVLGGATLSVDSDAELGNASGGIILRSGGELLTTANFTSARSVSLNPASPVGSSIITLLEVASTNTLAAAANTTATYTGMVFGTGGLAVGEVSGNNPGVVVLTNLTNSYTGGTIVQGGATLSVANDANLGDPSGGITLQGGELLTTATGFSSARAIVLSPADSNDTLAAVTSTTATYTGVISGVGDLTVGDGTHTGTVVLTGNNTYTGGLTIINGLTTLQIGNGGPTGSIPGNVLDNGNLVFKRSDDIIFSGNVSGTGTLSQISPGTLTLTGTNTYSGGTTISHLGTISVDSDTELGAAPEVPGIGGITLNSGELLTTANGFSTARAVVIFPGSSGPDTLAATNNTTATYTGVLSGFGVLDIGDGTNAGTLVFTGTNTYSGGTTILGGTLQIGNGGTSGSIVGNVLDLGNLTFDRSDVIPFPFAGIVSGSGTLNQIGSGTLTLTGTNTYTGGTFISGGGTVSVATDANLGGTGVGIGGITLQNGELLTTANFTTARSVSLNPVSLVGAVTPSDGLVAPNILAAAANTTATYTGVVFGTGGLTIGDGTNDGTVVLSSGANTYFGGTSVVGGATLSVDTDAELGDTSGGITLAGGELLTTQDGFSSARAVTLNTSKGANTLAAATATTATYTGVLSGDGGLTVGDGVNTGTVVLSRGTNTYFGGTTVIGGATLSVNTDAELGDASGGITLAGGELLTTQDGFSSARAVTLDPSREGTNTLAAAGDTTATYTGVLSGNGGLTVGGGVNTGTVVLSSGANTYFGGTTVVGGATLSVDTDAELGDTSGGITLTGGELITTLNGFSSARTVTLNTSGDRTNTLAAAGNTTATYAGVVSGNGGLTVGDETHSGTVVLSSGANTYFGGTTVVGGATLSVDTDAELGDSSGGITLAGGELLTRDSSSSTRAVTLNPSLEGTNTLAAATATTATYAGVVSGNGGLTIGDGVNTGTVVLSSGANTYFGGTTVVDATLSVDTDAELGDPSGGIILKSGGELLTTANFTSARSVSLNPVSLGAGIVTPDGPIFVAPNILAAAANTTATYTGVVFGTGGLTIGDGTNDGTVVLASGANIYFGGTTVIGGATLSVNTDAELGDPSGGITLTGGELLTTQDGFSSARAVTLNKSEGANTLAAATATTATYTGVVSGNGGLAVGDDAHAGIIIFTGNNTYLGGTAINFGTLQLGNPGTTGSIVGAVVNDSTFNIVNANTTNITTITNNPGAITNFFNANTASTANITNLGEGEENIGQTDFHNTSTAANATITNNGGETEFSDTSNAGNAHITNFAEGEENIGETDFFSTSNAANATIANNNGGLTQFFNTSNAANAHITNFGEGEGNGGETDFHNISNAANAIITNNAGGLTQFFDTSSAGTAIITNNSAKGEGNDGETDFNDTSTAANATINNVGGETDFNNGSTAANATINNNFGGETQFFDITTAANATIVDTGGATFFSNASTAGDAIITNNGGKLGPGPGPDIEGPPSLRGITVFEGTSTAASATITNNPGGETIFEGTTTAATATITNNPGGETVFQQTSTAANSAIANNGGETVFVGTSTAANASIINNNGATFFETTSTAANATIVTNTEGLTEFEGASTGGTATITTNNGGLTLFAGKSTGGQASFITNAGGIVDISPLSSGGMTAGSIAGAGTYFLGSKALTVGNDADTEVSGTIVDGGQVGGTGGALIKVGSGTLTLSGANTYTGGTTITTGTLQIGDGGGTGSILGNVINNAALVVNRSGTLMLAGVISGTGNLSQVGSGTLVLTGTNTYTGATAVSAGTLQMDGVLGNTAVTVQNAATLAGKGTIGGSVTILDGGHLAPGPGPQTLSVGTLSLNPTSILDYQLGTPGAVGSGVNTLVNVAGNLTLDGVLNVTVPDGGQFGSGSYRLLNYKGALTDLTLDLGTLPTGFSTLNTTVNTAVAGQVNLVVNAPNAPTQFWDGPNTVNDGTVQGGTGTWVNFTTTNFTNAAGKVNQAWQNGVAIFTAAPGTVTVGADILFQGMEFSSDGYTLVGSGAFALHPTGTATITTDTDVTATIAAPIVGTGGLNKAGPGLLTLSGQNTYSGGTTISDGALSVASDTNLGAANVGLELNGGELETSADFATPRAIALIARLEGANILAAAGNTTATYTGLISGAGGLSVGDGVHTGTVVLTNFNNSYSGGTSIFPGTLVAAGNDALGTGPVQLFNGTLTIQVGVTLPNEVTFVAGGVFNNAGTLNNDVLGSSAGTQMVINSGVINGNVALAGGTDIVQLFTGSKITGNLGLNGTNSTLILDGAGQQLLSQAVVGTLTNNGLLVKQGSGTWTIDRPLDAPLGTDILAGILAVDTVLNTPLVNITSGATLQLNAGGSVGNLVDNGSLIFAGTGTVNFTTVISGPGNVIQDGPGTTILSGKNTYSGGTIIDLGTLLVNNAQALGTGNVTVNGGVLGADPQPINVLGNYTQNAGGTLQLNIAGRSAGQFDVLNVNGNAFLNGTLRLVNQGYRPQLGDSLRLINTGGVVTGRFAQFQNPFALTDDFNSVDLVYARQSVTLEFLELNTPGVVSTTDFRSFALTPNQRAAADLLDAVQLDPRAANLISFLEKQPFANLPGDFNKISPDGLSAFYEISFSNANIQRLNLESRMDDLHHGSNGFSSNMKVNGATVNTDDRTGGDGKSSKAVVEPILRPGPENRWGVWMTGFGDFVSVDGDSNASGYNFTTGGVSLGIDYRLTDELAIGVMGEYSHTWTSLKPSGSIDVNSGRGGLYATWSHHGLYLNAAAYGGYNSYNSSRSALQGLASGNTEGAELSTFISGGYDFHFGLLTVGPIAALQYTYANIDGFSENGSLAPMQIHSDSVNSLRSDVGFRLFYQWQLGKVIIEPSLKAAWEHEYLYSALPITAGFASIPGPSATFTGPAEGHDSAIVSAGVSVQWTPTLTTYLNYDGQLGRSNYDSNAVTGGVRISF